jgi:hypothetical protein
MTESLIGKDVNDFLSLNARTDELRSVGRSSSTPAYGSKGESLTSSK